MTKADPECAVRAILFDFGGVVAEEGFVDGLKAVARENNLDPARFLERAIDLVYESGYVTGRSREEFYWHLVREEFGLIQDDAGLRREVVARFVIRPWMFKLVDLLRQGGVFVGLLSDQTNWLDEIDAERDVYVHFDRVFHSAKMGMSKREEETFRFVAKELGLPPEEILFVDDSEGHVLRAARLGFKTIHYRTRFEFEAEMRHFCPGVADALEELKSHA